MSQQIRFPPVPQDGNMFNQFHQPFVRAFDKTRVRSGIIERYTYKTDNGKLLSSTPLKKTCNVENNVCLKKTCNVENNVCSKVVSIPQNTSNLRANTCSMSRTTIIKTNVNKNIQRSLPPSPTKHHVIHENVTLVKLGNSSRDDEKVRTEHCDSTTDILENIEKKTMDILKHEIKLFIDDDYYEHYKKNPPSNSNIGDRFKRSSPKIPCDSDSDSDCQIIDIKLNDSRTSPVSKNKDRYPVSQDESLSQESGKTSVAMENLSNKEESPNSKVLNWFTNKLKEPDQSIIHVISDSEEDEDTKTFLCDKTGMTKHIKEIINIDNDSISSKCKLEQASSNVPQGVSSLVNSRTSPDLPKSKINTFSNMPHKDAVVFINAKYHSVKNKLNSDKKTNVILNSTELSQQNILLKSEPPEMCSAEELLNKTPPKKVMENRLEVTPPKVQKLNVQIQKLNSQLSPESMKSEFYSYLKINTNPLAQKAETVAQNRRSVRVKNLILQIEKNKELKSENTKTDKFKKNDVRKKFMKYSKINLVFPPPPIQHNKISDFNQTIEEYFFKEKINIDKLISPQDNEEQRNKRIRDEVKRSSKYRAIAAIDSIYKEKHKKFSKKKLLMTLKKQFKKKKDASYSTHLLADNKLRKLRFGPNRLFRDSSVRITRNSLDGYKIWNTKMLKARKAKLKAKIKNNHVESVSEKVNQECDQLKITNNHLENTVTEKVESYTSIIKCAGASGEKCSLPSILAKKLSDALQKSTPKIETVSKLASHSEIKLEKQSTGENENYPTTSLLETTKSKFDKPEESSPTIWPRTPVLSKSEDNVTPEFSPFTPMYGAESGKRLQLFLYSTPSSTPIYKPDSDKELELFTAPSSTPHKEKSNENTSENTNNSKERNISPPFLGFTSDESKRKQKVLDISLISKTLKLETNSKPELEIHKSDSVLQNVQPLDVISISSSENNTPVEDEESNSEQFSETSSIQEETQIPVQEVVDTNLIESGSPNYIPLNQNIRAKSFHKSLMQSCLKRKSALETSRSGLFELSDSDSSMSTPKTSKGNISKRSQTHEIDINKNNGAVFNTYYVNGVLIIVQEQLITFWKQTALGNILGVQNMWLPHGSIQRIILDPGCVNRRSSEMVLSCDNSVAYVELWTKEHKCVFRECPIADVFATIYFHKGHGLPDKKVLQLENIKGYGDDVRFAVIKNSREIIVSWCDTFSKPIKTLVRSYQLASDFQTVCSIKEMEFVSHYISSLHNIQDCDDLFLGAGNEQISVWNLRHGYLVTTLNLSETPVQAASENKTICLYVQCDTGFLFLIQQTEVGILRLVAVNGMTQEWKQLHSYQVPDNYNKLLGVVVESGVLMTCYTNGFLCWNMHSGEVLAEIDTPNELIVLPSNKYLVAIDNYQVTVQHIMSYILTHDW